MSEQRTPRETPVDRLSRGNETMLDLLIFLAIGEFAREHPEMIREAVRRHLELPV